ncbi:hypothetical protein [Paraflavitalea pollutisoli]|uniref:hypothetical protein n=1 Tax=Paraflavitalea pollutisoli TaxID=3034143 RepID=UPI0023EBBC87|nr:hypothetical protein [Paraflavitalea sp. H1-2-19X]
MRTKSLMLLVSILSLSACRKDKCPTEPPPNPKPINDIPAVQLRTMSVDKLPSPWYAFTYDTEGYITTLNHAAGVIRYDIDYLNGRVRTLQANKGVPGNVNKDILRYTYSNSLVATITVTNSNKQVYRAAKLTYTAAHQLQQLTWQIDTGSNVLIDEQTLTFSYYPDGNLRTIDFHQLPVSPFLDTRYADHFEQYDTKVNPDGFALLHTPLHHPVLLPSIRLQKNNPGRYYRTSAAAATFDARYTYTYDAAGRPVRKTGPVSFKDTNGTTGTYTSIIDFTW